MPAISPGVAPTRPADPLPARPRRPGRGADVVGAAVLLNAGVVLALWTANRGLQSMAAGAGPALTSAGRLLGLLAADLLLVQCLMMARIPWAERAWGQDRLARWHRLLGFTSFHALLAHVAVITVGYAVTDHESLPGQAWELVRTYPGLLLATAGTAMIAGVTVTSVRAARRRLRYESWHLLHLYAYLGVGLALPHQIWTGTDFIASAWARAYWWTLWAAAAAAVLACRLGLPAWRSWRHALRVAAVVPEAAGVVSVHLAARRLDRLGARAGQFLVLRFLDGPGWSRGHPYSLSAAPRPAELRVTIGAAGDGSARAARLRPGTRALLEGPYGRLTAAARTHPGRPVVLLGAGVGVAPLRALLDDLAAPGRTTLVVRARSERDLLFGAELDGFGAVHGVRVVPLVGPRARAGSWLPRSWAGLGEAAALRRLAPDIAQAEVYVCGPPGWADAVTAALARAGVPGERVHQERFAW
jgi:predicted ferric reductase